MLAGGLSSLITWDLGAMQLWSAWSFIAWWLDLSATCAVQRSNYLFSFCQPLPSLIVHGPIGGQKQHLDSLLWARFFHLLRMLFPSVSLASTWLELYRKYIEYVGTMYTCTYYIHMHVHI